VWNETEPWRRYPVGFKRPVSTAIALVDHDDRRKSRYLLTADHVLASYFRITVCVCVRVCVRVCGWVCVRVCV
jgi:hypothetical protein